MLQDLLISGALLFGWVMLSIRIGAGYLYDSRQVKSFKTFMICLSIIVYLVFVIVTLTDPNL